LLELADRAAIFALNLLDPAVLPLGRFP